MIRVGCLYVRRMGQADLAKMLIMGNCLRVSGVI